MAEHGLKRERFLVLHFGAQCPWLPWVIGQARQAAAQLGASARVVEVGLRPDLAARYRLFFPFMTVVDGAIRLPSPTPAAELVRIAREGLVIPPTVAAEQRPAAQAEAVLPLTAERIADGCAVCLGVEGGACPDKLAWAAEMGRRVPDGLLGFVAYQGGRAVGVVEFLPAPLVPYPLPQKDPRVAWITCLYGREDGPDFRGHLVEHLLRYLQGSDFRTLQVVAGRCLPYPNGPEPFFQQHGFETTGELDRVVLREGEDTIVLLRRDLG